MSITDLRMPLPIAAEELQDVDGFARRHIGPSDAEITTMLGSIGAGSLDDLASQAMPAGIRLHRLLNLPSAMSEQEALAALRSVAQQNQVFTSLIGMGYHGTFLPPVIQRNVLENPAWYTAYTPYQPEISQGRLEALLNFQTLVCDLTGLDVANASLLDEASAAAEAMMLAHRVSRTDARAFYVDAGVHPQTRHVLATRANALGWDIIDGRLVREMPANGLFGALFQYPRTFGDLIDWREPIERIQSQGGLAALAADPLSLTLLTSPGELGADIAIGSMQRFGVPMGYGGPHAAYMAVKDAHKRELPGRLVGVTVDAVGNPALRLALQTREQHIRREKATSNICTAQVLLAVIASFYAIYHGPEGLRHIARRIHRHATALAAGLRRLGFQVINQSWFDTLTVSIPSSPLTCVEHQRSIIERGLTERLNFRIVPPGEAHENAALGITLDETTTEETVEAIWRAFKEPLRYSDVAEAVQPRASQMPTSRSSAARSPDARAPTAPSPIPTALRRQSLFMTHPVFHRHRSETEMLRYLRRLSDKDLALDRTMIPLGSCTMKLNATAEMLPISWPEWSALHPYAPLSQAQGYRTLCDKLGTWLAEITGYDAVSLQPNSGAQGEYAGLLAIRAYHASRGEAQRTVCLIPASAHGTNPASAHLAGLKVVIVVCDRDGNVDLRDLSSKAAQHAPELAALMVTYPSTHGVFEADIQAMCDIVHRAGGQVYVDGANLNAQVGLARPGDYGADVSHINLHKTFCVPHGGGGPGMGPIGVKAHLVPFLPSHPLQEIAAGQVGPVSAAPYGSASILPISYLYMQMMGPQGLERASQVAILSANYIAERLRPHFPVLYQNAQGRVAHECIIDPRPLQRSTGVTVDDIAKRLIDYGFHAPTMSFPVAGTLMIEPTESESQAELDRFCDAMIAIRAEIAQIEQGQLAIAGSPLRHAPHTAQALVADRWTRPYTRQAGCFPHGTAGAPKYWAPVARIDHVYGDRHLLCTCPAVSEFTVEEVDDGLG